MAQQIILALNRAGVDAADGSLDDSISGGELEGTAQLESDNDRRVTTVRGKAKA